MTATLKRRLAVLETSMGINSNMPIIVFQPEPNDHARIERQAEIDQLKKSGRQIIILSLGDGWAVWKDGLCVSDGGLGHE